MTANDHPFDQVVQNANAQIAKGAVIFQKFTCAGCGNRLTMETPNTFYFEGQCDKCGVVTDLRKTGCNFMMIQTAMPLDQLLEVIRKAQTDDNG